MLNNNDGLEKIKQLGRERRKEDRERNEQTRNSVKVGKERQRWTERV